MHCDMQLRYRHHAHSHHITVVCQLSLALFRPFHSVCIRAVVEETSLRAWGGGGGGSWYANCWYSCGQRSLMEN